MDPTLCPNCQERFPTTDVVVDEVVNARYRSSGFGRNTRRTYSGKPLYGHLLLCPQCAAAYNRLERLRPIGRRTSNYAFASLFVGAGIYLLGAMVAPALATGPSGLLLAIPFALALLVLIVGLSIVIICRMLGRTALRFLTRPGLVLSAGTLSPTPAAPSGPASAEPVLSLAVGKDGRPLTPEQRRAARRRRRVRNRLFWAAAITGWLVVIALIVGGLGFAVTHLQQQSAGHFSYQDSLAGGASGWPQSNGCFSSNGAYHISPPGDKYALSCFAPTTNGYTDLDLSVTANLVSGPDNASYGLLFRVIDPGDAYVFEVFADGHARLDTIANGTVTPLSTVWNVRGMRTGTGQSNDLRVVARGSLITCYVNGTQVGQLSDTRFAGGQVGLFAGMPGIDVAYTNFSVQRP
jgi:hypothetical protein